MKKFITLLTVALIAAHAGAQNRLRISFPGYNVPNGETLQNFPALVVLTNGVGGSSFDFVKKPFADKTGAHDLRFYDADENELPYEIDTYKEDEILLAWVRVPELMPNGSTFITASWGGDTTQPGYTTNGAVWVEYAGVWHMNGSSGDLLDSTSNRLHAVRGNGVTAAAGALSTAQSMNGSGNIRVPHNIALNFGESFTVSGWFRYPDGAAPGDAYRRFFCKKSTFGAGDGWEVEKLNNAHNVFRPRGNNGNATNIPMPTGMSFNNNPREWYLLTFQYHGKDSGTVYVNGVRARETDLGTGTAANSAEDFFIGGTRAGGNENWIGFVDEVRIQKAVHSADRVWAEHAVVADPGFTAYEDAGVVKSLTVAGRVAGMPVEFADPEFGTHWDFTVGTNFTATAGALWTGNGNKTIAIPAGWEWFMDDGTGPHGNRVDFGGMDKPLEFEYNGVSTNTILWHFAVSNLVNVTAGAGGSVSPAGGLWCGSTNSLELLAIPSGPGIGLLRWEGDVDGGVADGNMLALPGDRPRAVKAVFAGVQHVATNGVDTNSGLSFADPKLTIAKAVEDAAVAGADYGLVLVSNGVYDVTSPPVSFTTATAEGQRTFAAMVSITNAVAVRGVSGNPADVVVRGTLLNASVFHLNHPGARLEHLTVREGVNSRQYSAANIHIDAAGGAVANCVITAGKSTGGGWGPFAGSVYMNSPHALMTHCVVTNNTAAGNANRQTGGVFIDHNGGRLEHSLIADNHAPEGGYWDLGNDAVGTGGLYMRGGSAVNCTVAGNSSRMCGGVYTKNDVLAAVPASLVNTVIAGNTATIEGATRPNAHAWCGHNTYVHNCFTDTPDPINSTCKTVYPNGLDVLLADVAAGNYFPAPNSPLINAAVPIPNPPALDLAGKPRMRGGKMDVGCYQADLENLTVSFYGDIQSGIIPVQVVFTAVIGATNAGETVELSWDFDGTGYTTPVAEQRVFTNTYNVAGTYSVTLHATATGSGGTRAESTTRSAYIRTAPPTLYVVPAHEAGKEAAEPFDSWDNAATNIQHAVDYALDGCEIILGTGGYPLKARVEIEKGVRFHSDTRKPEDVVIYNPNPSSALQVLYVNHEDARVDGVSLQGARIHDTTGGNLIIDGRGGTVSNCVIRNGHASGHASAQGVFMNSSKALVTHCVITNNIAEPFASIYGQATLVVLQGGRVENCLLAHNRWVPNGAGNNIGQNTTCVLEIRSGVSIVRNCTLAGNTVTGRGVVCADTSNANSAIVTNCVIAANLQWDGTGGPPPVWGGVNRVFASTVEETGAVLHPGNNVEDAGLIFKNAAAGNYRLKFGSQAVNAGPRVSSGEANAAGVDLDGNPRIYGFRMDHGCYELQHAGGTLLLIK